MMYWYQNMLFKKIIKKRINKENDNFFRQRWVKVMKNKTNCEYNIQLLFLETWNLLDGYMAKELI